MTKKATSIIPHGERTKVRRVQLRNQKIAITVYLDKPDALRLAKKIYKKWDKK